MLGYVYFKNYYKVIAKDLSKQQALDAYPKAKQQISFTANLDRAEYKILEEAKETVFEFSEGTVKVLWMQYHEDSNFYQYKNQTIQQFKCKAIKFTA